MEYMPKYKLTEKPRQDVFRVPNYCRVIDNDVKDTHEEEEFQSTLNLEVTNPGRILFLCESLSDNSSKALEMKVNKYLRIESLSTKVFLINICQSSEEAVVQVINETCMRKPFRATLSEDFYDHIVSIGNEYLTCAGKLDSNITALIEKVLGDEGGEVLSVPVISKGRKYSFCKNRDIYTAYIACFVNTSRSESYIVRLVNECFRFCLTIMINTVESEEEARLKRQSQSLLSVARKLFSRLVDINNLLKEIMLEARKLTNAERCSLFLLDPETKELVAKVFDGASPLATQSEVRIRQDQGIAVKMFQCERCDKRFSRKDSLTRHMRQCSEGGERAANLFFCFICLATSGRHDSLRKHCRAQHPGREIPSKKLSSRPLATPPLLQDPEEDPAQPSTSQGPPPKRPRLNTRWCTSCCADIQISAWSAHLKTLEHKRLSCTPSHIPGVSLVNQAFHRMMVIFRVLATGIIIDPMEFLGGIFSKVNAALTHQLEVHETSIKVNFELCGLYEQQVTRKREIKSHLTKAAPITTPGQIEEVYQQQMGVLQRKAQDFQEKDSGHVAATGNLLNIKNAYEHPLFFKGVDEATGFKTRNILCFPIRDEDGVVGVAQLCNKKSGGNFDYFDEEVANAFSIYCGLSIVHSLMYKKINDAQARTALSNELMMYHMKVSPADVADLIMCPGCHQHPDLDKFYFSPRNIILKETPCFVLKMIEELNIIDDFKVRKDTLGRFVLFVKRGYRDTPYHNWWHAFSVAHFAYLCIKNFKLDQDGYLTKLECFALIISCLCHDIDHRGTTNSFQQQVNSTLASLYSSEGSVMERHHLSQTLCILNTQGCNILEELSSTEYRKCLDYIKDMILATDLANHFKLYRRQLLMVQEGYKRNKNEHRFVFVCLLMTCADLSDQTKNWSVAKKVAQHVYEEFFKQGDLEKQMGRDPIHMMDREQASIPDLQIEFLKNVCLPVFQLLVVMFPCAKILVENIKKNMLCWETSKKIFEKFSLEGKISLEALTSMSLEEEVLQIVDEVLKS